MLATVLGCNHYTCGLAGEVFGQRVGNSTYVLLRIRVEGKDSGVPMLCIYIVNRLPYLNHVGCHKMAGLLLNQVEHPLVCVI